MLASLNRKLNLSSSNYQKLITIALILITIIYSLSGVFYPTERQKLSTRAIQPVGDNAKAQLVGFAQEAVYPTTQNHNIIDNIKLYGSWLGSDRTTGTASSTWYRATNHFYLLVAGYPSLPGNSLTVEVSTRSGSIQEIALNQQNPGETWSLRKVSLAQIKEAEKFRVRATDSTIEMQGWLGFSQPFMLRSITKAAIVDLFRIFSATIATIVIFISPGLILRFILWQRFATKIPFIWLPFPGIGAMACIGLITWLSAKVISPIYIVLVVIIPYLIFLLNKSFKVPITAITSKLERRAIQVFVVVVIIAVAKASYSLGPVGELYGGTVSRTLEVGDRSDSRISYHVVQLIAHGTDPYSELGKSYFAPWSFSHRGPLAGMAASPVVFLSGANVPNSMPNQPWTPFDLEGFSAYRIAMIVMGASSLLVLFGLVEALMGEQWALMTLLVTATTPFIIHEVYFTWPKLQAGMSVLLAAYLIIRQQSTLSGLATGVGYLFHPSALLSVPPLICLIILNQARLIVIKERVNLALKATFISFINILKLFTGVIALWLLWRLLNSANYAQSDFFNYIFQAEGSVTSTFWIWMSSRLNSFFNTTVPMNLFIFHQSNPAINSISGESPTIIRFFFQYWNTLPFGVGILYFFYLIRILFTGATKLPYLFVAIILLPLLSFTVYWGAAITGMLREGLHVWVFSIIVFTSLVFRKYFCSKSYFWKNYNTILGLRGFEVIAMLLIPIWASKLIVVNDIFILNDIIMLLLMLAGTAWLSWQVYLYGEKLRKSNA